MVDFGERRIEDAVAAELRLQPVRHAEDAAEPPDILAVDQHTRVAGERIVQREVERLAHRDRLRASCRS